MRLPMGRLRLHVSLSIVSFVTVVGAALSVANFGLFRKVGFCTVSFNDVLAIMALK